MIREKLEKEKNISKIEVRDYTMEQHVHMKNRMKINKDDFYLI